MNILILHAHPEPKSFTSSLKDLAVDHFKSAGHEVVVSDLYKMNFNPVGWDIDFKARANPETFSYMKEQMNAFKTNSFADDLKEEMDKLVRADLVIFNSPLWWSSFPAILKGWCDRVFALGFAYHPKEKLYDSGVFRGKKAMCVLTAGGSKSAYSEGGANGDIMMVLYHIHHGLLYYSGMDVLPPFITWRTHLESKEVLESYLVDYKNHLLNLDNLEPLF